MVSIIKVDHIKSATGTTVTIPSGQTITNSGTATGFGGGAILQVKYIEKLDDFSMSGSTTNSDITGLSLAITPASTANKVLVIARVNMWGNDATIRIDRGGSMISVPTSIGSRTACHAGGCSRISDEPNNANIMILDAPSSTSALTYNISMNGGTSSTAYCNRPDSWGTGQNNESLISTLTLIEIASGSL